MIVGLSTGLNIFSETSTLHHIDEEARLAIVQALQNSQFKILSKLQQAIAEQIRESRQDGKANGQGTLLTNSSKNDRLEKQDTCSSFKQTPSR